MLMYSIGLWYASIISENYCSPMPTVDYTVKIFAWLFNSLLLYCEKVFIFINIGYLSFAANLSYTHTQRVLFFFF